MTKQLIVGPLGPVCAVAALALLVATAVARAETAPTPDAGPPAAAPEPQGSDQCEAKAAERGLTGNHRGTFIERCEQRRAERQASRATVARPGRMGGRKAAQ